MCGEDHICSDTAQEHKRVFRIGSAKLVCRLEPEATTLIAYGLFEFEGSCFAKRNWQEHSSKIDEDAFQERVAAKHLRVVKVATGSNPADIQTQRLVRQNLMRRRWTRNSRNSRSSRMSSLQLKRWKRVLWIEFSKWSRVDNGQVVEPEGIIESSDVVLVGTSQRERRNRITSSRIGDFTPLGERRVS